MINRSDLMNQNLMRLNNTAIFASASEVTLASIGLIERFLPEEHDFVSKEGEGYFIASLCLYLLYDEDIESLFPKENDRIFLEHFVFRNLPKEDFLNRIKDISNDEKKVEVICSALKETFCSKYNFSYYYVYAYKNNVVKIREKIIKERFCQNLLNYSKTVKQNSEIDFLWISAYSPRLKYDVNPNKDARVNSIPTVGLIMEPNLKTSNEVLLDFVKTTINNIKGLAGKNTTGRRTKGDDSHIKVQLLQALATWLEQPIPAGQEVIVMAILKSVCGIRRHALNRLFSPHSVHELKTFIKENEQVCSWVDERVIISKQQMIKLIKDKDIPALFEEIQTSSTYLSPRPKVD